MTNICGNTVRRYRADHILTIMAVLFLFVVSGCTTVPINPNDSSPPKVSIKVKGPNGYQEQTSIDYVNNPQQYVEIICAVEDPQGVKSLNLYFSKSTVNVAYCGGVSYSGTFHVDNLPSALQDTLSGSSGSVPTKLPVFMQVSGVLPIVEKPAGPNTTCYPGNNQGVILKCVGENWSSNAGASTTTKSLEIKF